MVSVDGVSEPDLLEVEDLHRHLHGQPLVLGCVAAGFLRQLLAVDGLAEAVAF